MASKLQLENKNEVTEKLTALFHDEPKELSRILFCLNDEEKQSRDESNPWDNLQCIYHLCRPQEFKQYARSFANKTRDCGDMEKKYNQTLQKNEVIPRSSTKQAFHTASDDSWKDKVRAEITKVFEDEPETFARILFYLDEEDKQYSPQTSPVWKVLKSAMDGSKDAFRNYLRNLAKETLDNDDEVEEEKWKLKIRAEITKVLQYDPDTFARVLLYLDEEDK